MGRHIIVYVLRILRSVAGILVRGETEMRFSLRPSLRSLRLHGIDDNGNSLGFQIATNQSQGVVDHVIDLDIPVRADFGDAIF
jgi:hypothetical protein